MSFSKFSFFFSLFSMQKIYFYVLSNCLHFLSPHKYVSLNLCFITIFLCLSLPVHVFISVFVFSVCIPVHACPCLYFLFLHISIFQCLCFLSVFLYLSLFDCMLYLHVNVCICALVFSICILVHVCLHVHLCVCIFCLSIFRRLFHLIRLLVSKNIHPQRRGRRGRRGIKSVWNVISSVGSWLAMGQYSVDNLFQSIKKWRHYCEKNKRNLGMKDFCEKMNNNENKKNKKTFLFFFDVSLILSSRRWQLFFGFQTYSKI